MLLLSAHVGLVGSYALLTRTIDLWIALLIFAPLCLAHQKYLSEWIHEGAHFNIHANKVWNDFLTNILAGVFFANNVAVHRVGHFIHHRVNSYFNPDDPDTRFLVLSSRKDFILQVALDLCGWNALKLFFLQRPTPRHGPRPSNSKFYILLASFHLIVITSLLLFGSWPAYLVYYATLLTLYPLMNRLRVYGQHVCILPDGRGTLHVEASRTLLGGWLDRFFISSSLMKYHYEHHLYPHLPYRALRDLHYPSDDQNRFGRSRSLTIRALWKGLEW